MTGWEQVERSWRQWYDLREATKQTCAELRTERLVKPDLGCIKRAREHGPFASYKPVTSTYKRYRHRRLAL